MKHWTLKAQQATARAQQQEKPVIVVDSVTSRQHLLPTRGQIQATNYKYVRQPLCQYGRAFHQVNQYPAIDTICWRCHFQHMCGFKLLAVVNVQKNTDYQFLDTITTSQVDTTEAGGSCDGSSSNDLPTKGIENWFRSGHNCHIWNRVFRNTG